MAREENAAAMGVRPWDVSAEPSAERTARGRKLAAPPQGHSDQLARAVAEQNLFHAAVTHLPTAAKKGAHGGNMVSP
jgi:hypothetical protein